MSLPKKTMSTERKAQIVETTVESEEESEESEEEENQKRRCPECDRGAVITCKCRYGDSTCRNGHKWHYDPKTKEVLPGHSH